MGSLTVATVRKTSTPGRLGDGGGLYLVVSKGGSKSWVQRVRLGGIRTDKGIGGFPSVSLTEARKIANANRVAIDGGDNPFKVKATISAPEVVTAIPDTEIFEGLARALHPIQARQFKNPKHGKNWIQTLEKHVFPHLGGKPVAEITRRDVIACMEKIWYTKPDSARRIRLRIRAVLDYAVEMEMIPLNVERGITKLSLPPQPKTKEHFKALPWRDVPTSYHQIRNSKSLPATRLAFQFLILTAARSGEVRGATWAEIDRDTWTIPAARMKTGAEHRVPLSIQAQQVLREAREKLGTKEGLIFPGSGGKMLSDNAFSLRARKEDLGCTPHGYRSSFRSWSAETSEETYDVLEMCLAHYPGNEVERAYQRSDQLERRRPVMDAWANLIEPLPF